MAEESQMLHTVTTFIHTETGWDTLHAIIKMKHVRYDEHASHSNTMQMEKPALFKRSSVKNHKKQH